MRIALTERAVAELAAAPFPIQRAFLKQINFLVKDIRHPSLRSKKYDEGNERWQSRINDDWRFYFSIEEGGYSIDRIIPHPK